MVKKRGAIQRNLSIVISVEIKKIVLIDSVWLR